MPVRPRGKDSWQVDISHKSLPNGRGRWQFDREAAATAWEKEAQNALARGLPLPSTPAGGAIPGVTLQAIFDEVVHTDWSRQKASEQTIDNARRFVGFIGPLVPPSEAFTDAEITRFIKHLMSRRLSNGTINRYLSAISKLMKRALKAGNITALVELPWQKEGVGRIRYFSLEEEALILQTLRLWGYEEEHDFMVFLIDTGARPYSEAARFQRADVDVKLRKATFWDTKNGKSRSVKLTTRAFEAVQRQMRRHAQGVVFGAVKKSRMTRAWGRLQTHLPQLADAVVYTARHTCASRLVQRGVDLLRVKTWMGHEAIETTLRYAHLSPNHLDDCAAALEPIVLSEDVPGTVMLNGVRYKLNPCDGDL